MMNQLGKKKLCSPCFPTTEEELPLPVLEKGRADRDALVKEQQEDPSLQLARSLAKDNERGCSYDQGILVHTLPDELNDSTQRIVLPNARRGKVLEFAHTSTLAGHFSIRKTRDRLSKHFIWPGMSDFTVIVCHGLATIMRGKQEVPCISRPFGGIVGPLTRTTKGHKYLLTAMCLYTRYPEAIPLKGVDAVLEIFSRHGLPDCILTNQGSVFMSKITSRP